MASIQSVRVHGKRYWRIVESRRINGKPRPVVLAYLGKPDDLLARLQAADEIKVQSSSHGAVAALFDVARQLQVAETIDRHLAASGSRQRKPPVKPGPQEPSTHDGLSVGESLQLASIGRACHPTSKRAFSQWAQTTTLGQLAHAPLAKLTSQHFWDQMDQVPIETIALIEKELIERVPSHFELPMDTLLYDATNFFTFIDSANTHPELPARGHNKQKRHDLRQVSVALLCTRRYGIPLWHMVYGGNVPDAKSFPESFAGMRQRLTELNRDLDSLTLVYDRGNVSRANQALVDGTVHYVASLTASSQRALIAEANGKMEPVRLDEHAEAERTVMAYRTRRVVFGSERTLVVVLSEGLREGQQRGVLQHVASAQRWLQRLSATLERGKQRRDRARIQRDIEARLMGRQHLRKVLRVQLQEEDGKLTLTHTVDVAALQDLYDQWLGRIVLMTDRDQWSTAEIIRAYRAQADVEGVFAHLKDPTHIAIRPQFHWTDQKLHVHVFTCIVGYLLARLVHLKAVAAGYQHGMERLLDDLEQVRRVVLLRPSLAGKGRPRTSTQIESAPEIEAYLPALGVKL